ncbi:EF-P beta-lysylation protein EpmB [Thiomicrorhabdus sp. 6S3-12]|uniref:EF-P beta-lysylation protein EpmB n=1 Tax=Thiomicrorhabdus sp. 6S3-12 TaxID=2819681 RepID=UPI001AADF914|nr:EF-P beta-lysylation protein EpmB [Thiomicrorhabdus sp. 6S3-12]MBO1923714.1 EF-P beta-lysylation protein EpmB [Thiomicrorhabdus sp. 6S3-12]
MRKPSATAQSLITDLGLQDALQQELTESAFAFKAPRHFIAQIKTADAEDPLLKQVLPLQAENHSPEGYQTDPVGDHLKNPQPSLIHKYHGRVLLIASPKCDIHCRYCFRRHFPYENHANQRHWQKALETISADPTLHEVILSGGDPMSLSENALLKLCRQIEAIEQISTLRVHSRTPVVAPDKAAQNQWLAWTRETRLNVVMVVHSNHANELSEETAELFRSYREAGMTLLNQSVLLKGVNDSIEVLEALSHKLFAQGILPYYLHQLDKVNGASHFEVEDRLALNLHEQLRQRLPGYLVPKLVREIAGEPYKTPLTP